MFARSPWSGLVSIWLGTDHGLESAATRNLVLLIVALIKVRYIGLYFMNLRSGLWRLRGLFEFYCLAVCLILVAMYQWV